jgi:hypothetical protein
MSLSLICLRKTGRDDRWKGQGGVQGRIRLGSPYALLLDGLPRPPWTQVAGQPMFLFVMVNKAHRNFAASVKGKKYLQQLTDY